MNPNCLFTNILKMNFRSFALCNITFYDDFTNTRLIKYSQLLPFLSQTTHSCCGFICEHFVQGMTSLLLFIDSTRFGKMHCMGKQEASSVITLQHHCYVTAE